ncbi:MAG: hypothetical protein M0P39_13610 [Rhodocyclaceae bacterium]|nr:hypothetical protein [Rhodocyclaceae bacterium]
MDYSPLSSFGKRGIPNVFPPITAFIPARKKCSATHLAHLCQSEANYRFFCAEIQQLIAIDIIHCINPTTTAFASALAPQWNYPKSIVRIAVVSGVISGRE